jgi:RNA polymerase sigma-70 factor (ECF subfamily)
VTSDFRARPVHPPPIEPEPTDFDRVVAAHGGALARYAWGYVDTPADHADLVQEILVALWQALPRFRGESSVWTFVFRVAHNRALSYLGRERRWRAFSTSPPATPEPSDPRPGPEEDAELSVRRRRLVSALRRLPESQRQAVILHLEGATPKEIAAVQGVTENNASVRLTRARRALRELLAGGAT